jgi:hypothetical protein
MSLFACLHRHGGDEPYEAPETSRRSSKQLPEDVVDYHRGPVTRDRTPAIHFYRRMRARKREEVVRDSADAGASEAQNEEARTLRRIHADASSLHTRLCSRLSQFEGLVRLLDQTGPVPRFELVRPLPNLEKELVDGLACMLSYTRELTNVSASADSRTEEVKKALTTYLQLVHDQINPRMQEMRAERQKKVRDDSPLFSPELTPVFPLRSVDYSGVSSTDSLADTTPPLSFIALGDMHPSSTPGPPAPAGPSSFLRAACSATKANREKAEASSSAPFKLILSSEFCST